MDYVIFIVSAAFLMFVNYVFSFPKQAKEVFNLFWREKNLKDLKMLAFMSKLLMSFSLALFFIFCFVIWVVWDDLQQNMIQKLSLLIFSVSAVYLLVLVRKTYLIKRSALNISHSICENIITDATVEEQKKGLWICKFNMYHEDLFGYLDEKPSANVINVVVLKYDNRKKMYLLQELH